MRDKTIQSMSSPHHSSLSVQVFFFLFFFFFLFKDKFGKEFRCVNALGENCISEEFEMHFQDIMIKEQ